MPTIRKPRPILWVQQSHQVTANGFAITVPVMVVSEANQREHWSRKLQRKKGQKLAVAACLCSATKPTTTPLTVTMVRLHLPASRAMDDDNLVGAFKAIRDTVAAWLGIDDGGTAVVWVCKQQTCHATGVRIEIAALERYMAWTDGKAGGHAS